MVKRGGEEKSGVKEWKGGGRRMAGRKKRASNAASLSALSQPSPAKPKLGLSSPERSASNSILVLASRYWYIDYSYSLSVTVSVSLLSRQCSLCIQYSPLSIAIGMSLSQMNQTLGIQMAAILAG